MGDLVTSHLLTIITNIRILHYRDHNITPTKLKFSMDVYLTIAKGICNAERIYKVIPQVISGHFIAVKASG